MSSIITPTIKEKIKSITKDSTERDFLLAILNKELTYVDKARPAFKDDYRDILEKYYPFKEQEKN